MKKYRVIVAFCMHGYVWSMPGTPPQQITWDAARVRIAPPSMLIDQVIKDSGGNYSSLMVISPARFQIGDIRDIYVNDIELLGGAASLIITGLKFHPENLPQCRLKFNSSKMGKYLYYIVFVEMLKEGLQQDIRFNEMMTVMLHDCKSYINNNDPLSVHDRNFRQTPLHIAAEQGDGNFMRQLIDCGADIARVNEDRKTAWEILKKKTNNLPFRV